MKSPQVSVIIRTFNEEMHISLLIETMLSQSFDQKEVELIIVDSGSTDQTLSVIDKYDARLIELPHEEFTFSKALNLGIKKSRGKWLIIVSAHAIPMSKNWVSSMVDHLKDGQVAGVYCRQSPWPDAPWNEKIRIENTFPLESRTFDSEKDIDALHFSNAASCISKKLWQRQPFIEIPAAEDRAWALWAIRNKYKIMYDASISVFHSHKEKPRKAAYRLIEISKAIDINSKRQRTFILTLRNAISLCFKDSKQIFQYDGCKGNRLYSVYYSFCRAFWFFWDYRDC